MPNLGKGLIPLDLTEYMDVDKSLINAYLYVYPMRLSSKVKTKEAGVSKIDNDRTAFNDLTALNNALKNIQTDCKNISNARQTLREDKTEINNILGLSASGGDTATYKTDVASICYDSVYSDEAIWAIIEYFSLMFYHSTTSNNGRFIKSVRDYVQPYLSSSLKNSGTIKVDEEFKTIRKALSDEIKAIVNVYSGADLLPKTIVKRFADSTWTSIETYVSAMTSMVDSVLAVSSSYSFMEQTSPSVTNQMLYRVGIKLGAYSSKIYGVVLDSFDIQGNRTESGVVSRALQTKLNEALTNVKRLAGNDQKLTSPESLEAKTRIAFSINRKDNQFTLIELESLIDDLSEILNTTAQDKTEANKTTEKSVFKEFQNFYFIFPILDPSIEQAYSFSWEEFEYGQFNSDAFIGATVGKSVIKLGVEAGKQAMKNSAANAIPGASTGANMVGKVLDEVSALAGDENLRNAIQQKTGQAFVKPKKKIFKGTGYLSHSYKCDNIIPKSKEAHMQVLLILKLFELLIMPTQRDVNMIDKIASTIMGSMFGKSGSNIVGKGLKEQFGKKVSDFTMVLTDLYLYTMSYPMTFRGIIKTRSEGQKPVTLKFWPESAVSSWKTKIDLSNAFYGDTNLPQTISFEMNFDELVPFHMGTAIFSPEADTNNIENQVAKLNGGTVEDKLSVYQQTFSIL